jgi:hypothetical protein
MRKIWSAVADAIECYSGASSLTRRVTGFDGLRPSGMSASNPNRKGGASVHGPVSYSTLDMMDDYDHAKGVGDVG